MKQKSTDWFKFRIVFISTLLVVCFALIVGRMFQLQVLKKEQLYKLADRQQNVQIPLVTKRGTIYDSQGNELAVSIEVDSVYADARKIDHVRETARALASVLQIDPEELAQRLKNGRSFEWVQRKISPEEAEQVRALHLPGISFVKENRRFYPNDELAAHLIGFVGLDSKGLEGIEFQYDALLNGENQVWTAARDALGRQIATGDTPLGKEEDHKNIVLTIDRSIQHIVETELKKGGAQWGAKGGMVIAMEPSTGKILAMASFPAFNPNQFIQYRSKNWRNRAVSDVFEPGSLFKTFLAAAAIEERLVRPMDSLYCENGSYKVYDRTIHDHVKYKWLTFKQVLKYSSNIGASKVGEKIGKERFYRYISSFGFGEKTQVNLPGEGKGLLNGPGNWSPVALDTISFGQGISVTGLQMVTALCAIANGGALMKPYVVEKILNDKGEVLQSFQPEMVKRVISEDTAYKVARLLEATTEKGGTGEEAVPAGYEIAGKTGTAQKADALLGGYSEDRYTSGFMGFAPVENPKLVLLVVIDEPQGDIYGGVVAAPIFRAIVEKVLPYLNVIPKGTTIVKNELDFTPRKAVLESQPLIENVRVSKRAGAMMMPDLMGLSMRNALSRIEGSGLIIKLSGNGKVVEQTPRPGTVLEKGDVCYLKLQTPS